MKKKLNKTKLILFLLMATVIFTSFSFLNKNKKSQVNILNSYFNGDTSTEYVGENAVISVAAISSRKTGTADFDIDEGPGNDVSEDDDIVRSFDTIKYVLNSNMIMKNSSSYNNLREGILNLEVVFPSECADIIKANKNVMNWDENIEEYKDGDGNYVIKAKYNLKNEENVVIPGNQTLNIGIDVLNGKNNQEIKPKFIVWLDGNDDNEKKILEDSIVTVSAAPKYNVLLNQSSNLKKNVTLNYENNDHKGKIFGYSFVLQLLNEEGKGLKGIEIPNGDISFDIDLKLEKGQTDITNDWTPLLWNYKVNSSDTNDGVISQRQMQFGTASTAYGINIAPFGKATSNRLESVYDSGNIQMIQNGSKITATISDYQFDWNFPRYNCHLQNYDYSQYDYNIDESCFATGYFQIFVENDEQNENVNNSTYKLTVSDSNFKTNSLSNDEITIQQKDTDDLIAYSFKQKPQVSFAQLFNVKDLTGNETLKTSSSSEDARVKLTKKYELLCRNDVRTNSDYDIHASERIIKFDANTVQPIEYDGGKKYRTSGDGNMQFNVYYLTKLDGSNWVDENEKNSTEVTQLQKYNSISEIPDDKLCVGIYIESKSDLINDQIPYSSSVYNILLPFEIKPTAEIGRSTSVVTRVWSWKDVLDRNVYSLLTQNREDYPIADYDSGVINYTATTFNNKGEVIEVSNQGTNIGESLLVVAANQSVDIESINEQNTNSNTVFDIGKGQSVVKYKLTPRVEKIIQSDIDGVTINIEATLPNGLSYILGSFNKEEYSASINKNIDFNVQTDPTSGESVLKFSIYNYTVGESIEPIYFETKIDESSLHGTEYDVSAYIYGDMEKIGNTLPDLRKKDTKIQVINFEAHRLFKEVNTPVVEKNDIIKYTLTYINKTDLIDHNFIMLDVLPNNATEELFSGNYKVKQINIKQFVNDEEVAIDELKLYGTNDQSVLDYNANSPGIGTDSIWSEKSINTILNEEMTACAVKGDVKANAVLKVEILLDMKDSNEGDVYPNTVTARIDENSGNENLLRATREKAIVVTRSISGMLWYDSNENGIKDENEMYADGVNLILTDELGNNIDNTTTSLDGTYEFKSLAKGKYSVKIDGLSKYVVSDANVGTNSSINSKFKVTNGVKQSEVITTLDSLNDPILSQQYINAGLIVKNSKVLVKYLDENGEEITYKDFDDIGNQIDKSYSYELTGKVDEDYSTQQLDIDGYKFVSNTNNKTGTFAEEDIVVEYRYVYNKIDIDVIKIWQDNDNEAQKRPNSTIIELYANDVKVDEYEMVTTSNSATHTFINKEKYDSNIDEITYTIKEKEKNVDDLKFYETQVNNNNNTYTITDTFNVPDEKINVEANIKWQDNNNEAQKRPEKIKVVLFENGDIKEIRDITDTSLNTNTVTFINQNKYDSLGNEIVYSIDEIEQTQGDLKFYSKTVNASTNTITNTFTVPEDKINLITTISWEDNNNQNNSRPESLTIYLKNKEEIVTTAIVNNTTESYDFLNVAKYDTLGNEIDYTVDINDIVGYEKRLDGMQITNMVKAYSITTSVEGDGGAITDGNESVTYNGNSSKVIKITPDFGYKISKIKINGNEIDYAIENDETYTLDSFRNVNENKNIVVSFEKKESNVIAIYVTEDNNPISSREVLTGKYMEEYETHTKEFDDYDLIEIIGNTKGNMAVENIVVIYKYRKVKGNITLHVVDESDSGANLYGFEFKIERLKEDNTVDNNFSALELMTDDLGKIEYSDLPVGKYRITQIKAKYGYILNEDSLEFEINKNSRNIDLSFNNMKEIKKSEEIKNVNTGNAIVIIIVVLCVAITIFISLSIVLKKRNKKV